MKRIINLLLLTVCIQTPTRICCQETALSISNIPTSASILKGQQLILQKDDKEIGSLSYVCMPYIRWYVLYDFYIEPEQRHQGYGKKLLRAALDEIINAGARYIFIQPGPFENVDGDFVQIVGPARESRTQKLISLYKLFSFQEINSPSLCSILNGVYKIIGIDEDAHYLLMRTILK